MTTDIYSLSLHDALPIYAQEQRNAAQNVYRSVEHDQRTGLTTFGQFHQHHSQMELTKRQIGRAVQQECRDRSRMPSSALKKERVVCGYSQKLIVNVTELV